MEDTNINVRLSLLLNLRAIINVASQRGAFRPEEFKPIGTVYEQLNEVIPKPPAQEDPTTPTNDNETKTV
jgi:hypothetical protein